MSTLTDPYGTIEAQPAFSGFQDLMPYRVQDILLVSSLYDSFALQEDGRLNELMVKEFLDLNLHHTPGLTQVSSGAQALEMAREQSRFNLIVTTIETGDMDASELASAVRDADLDVPVVVLAYDNQERKAFMARRDISAIDRIFLWQGDARILTAIVKHVEDERNVAHDTAVMGVRVILVVEDNIRYYSSFLPAIYDELTQQSLQVIHEGVNLSHKLVRLRARPKILLCTTFEEAWDRFTRYREHVLGIISDIEYLHGGERDPNAGFELARKARAEVPDLPILLQSSRPEAQIGARAVGAAFLRKGSPTLLSDLRHFLVEQFAFGDFVFRLRDGTEVGRASDLKQLEQQLATVPAESIGNHGERNHFSNWLIARTEFALAHKLRPRKVSDFRDLEDLRNNLIEAIADYRREQSESRVRDFNRATFDAHGGYFARIGSGSLGGKARGLAFLRHLLHRHGSARRFQGVRIVVPPAVVVATGVFDRFLENNGLVDFAIRVDDDAELVRRFLAASFPQDARDDLTALLQQVSCPLAVRSSSLLEDSQYQPFTGVYETMMLPNIHPSLEHRVEMLITAIKRVYASTFTRHAKAYLKATPFSLEEEKMAVVVQNLVGSQHDERFYPDFSGVARSHNFYPMPPLEAADGIAAVALGLGHTVVSGEKCLTFSPRHPQHLLQFSSVTDILGNSQREFWALELGVASERALSDPTQLMTESRFGLEYAEQDGTLDRVGSTYSQENNAVYDGLSRPGVRLVSFAPILKYGVLPLAEVLDHLLEIGHGGMNRPVELEFAVRLGAGDEPAEFGLLQMRPLVLAAESGVLEIEDVEDDKLVCRSPRVLGNGLIDEIRDAVVVDFHEFERANSRDAARAVARFNAQLQSEGRPYLLIGVGRWGSTDPWLGIPVTWDEISGARVIVEAGFRDIHVQPSQGSHFFQNLTSFQVGYFITNPEVGEGFVDWEWLAALPAQSEIAHVRLLRFDQPLVVKMNGRNHEGVIYKP